MKTLTITYADVTIFDGPVDEFTWVDTSDGVTVTGKVKPQPRPSGGVELLKLLTAARRQTPPENQVTDQPELAGDTDSERTDLN
jgi:hypothetical protein